MADSGPKSGADFGLPTPYPGYSHTSQIGHISPDEPIHALRSLRQSD